MGVSVLLQDQADRTAARRESVRAERWLLTGATGQLGRHLIALIGADPDRPAACLATSRRGGAVAGLSVQALDMRDADELDRLLADHRPTHVVHLASLSQPTQAHADPQGFHDLTVQATWRLARHVRAVGGWMFYPSSDFVLCGDGPGLRDEGAAVCGDSVYARGKLAGERVVLESGAGCVGRLSLLWGTTADDTPWGQLVGRLLAGQAVHGITDELRTPLQFAAAARIVMALAAAGPASHRGHRGLVNIGGDRAMTPFALISQLRDTVAPGSAVLPVTRAAYSPAVPRPANAALDIGLLRDVLGASVLRAIGA